MTQEELRLLDDKLRQIPLEELNEITIQRMAGVEVMMTIRNRNGGKRYVTNALSIIPLEELHDSNIMTKTLVDRYSVNKMSIIKYRKEHNIPKCKVRPKRVNNTLSVIPLEELNNGRISIRDLHEKYKVCGKELIKYRKEHNIKFIRPNRRK